MFSSARMDKIEDLSDAINHNKRLSIAENITAEQTKHNIYSGFKNPMEALKKRVELVSQKAKQTIRKDAHTAVEVVFNASPEFFYDDLKNDPDLRVRWDSLRNSVPEDREIINRVKNSLNVENLRKWKKATEEFAKEYLGENLVSMDLHLDEKTPHIHCLAACEIQGRISMKKFYTPARCRELQTIYNDKVKHLGLKRGVENSQKETTPIKEFNNSTNNIANAILDVAEEEKTTIYTSKNYWINKNKAKTGIYTQKEVDSIIDDVAKSWNLKNTAKKKVIEDQKKIIDTFEDKFKTALQNELQLKATTDRNQKLKAENKGLKQRLRELHKVTNNNVLDKVFSKKPALK